MLLHYVKSNRMLASCLGALVAMLLSAPSPVLAAPRTVVTLKPIHALVAGVMAGVAEPVLLVKGGASPHGHAMKPSDARTLAAAELVIWVGPEMESFFIKPARSLKDTVEVLTLIDRKELKRLPPREGGAWVSRHDDNEAHGFDPHIWLDPANGRAIVALVADTLSGLDPSNAPAYRANAARMVRELNALEQEIAGLLAPLRHVPYVVFHDAYRYFEARFRTNAVGSISISPDRPPGARRLLEIRRRIKEAKAACIFAEPQFTPRLIETAREGLIVRAATLDPLGAEIKAGPGAYKTLLLDMALSLTACLEG
jgi:zinc transport system substrate-binding protein